MRIAYTILEVDRHENANLIRSKLSFLDEMKTVVCDARKEYPDCIKKYPEFRHVFNSITNLGLIGLWISNLNAFYSLLDSDYDSILIFEDDSILVDDFESKFKTCLQQLPTDFGLFAIGCEEVYLNYYLDEHKVPNLDHVCKLYQTGCSWGMLYKKEFVKELLDVIVRYKILGGFPDTGIMSYALGNVGPKSNYTPYGIPPSIGTLITHDSSQEASTLKNSPTSGQHINGII